MASFKVVTTGGQNFLKLFQLTSGAAKQEILGPNDTWVTIQNANVSDLGADLTQVPVIRWIYSPVSLA